MGERAECESHGQSGAVTSRLLDMGWMLKTGAHSNSHYSYTRPTEDRSGQPSSMDRRASWLPPAAGSGWLLREEQSIYLGNIAASRLLMPQEMTSHSFTHGHH